MKKSVLFFFALIVLLSACTGKATQNLEDSESTEAPTQTDTPLPTQQPTFTSQPSPTPIPILSINPENAGSLIALENITGYETPIRNIFLPGTNSFITMSIGKDRSFYLWEINDMHTPSKNSMSISEYPYPPIAISPDGNFLSMRVRPPEGGDSIMSIFNLKSGEIIAQFEFQTGRLSHVINDIKWSQNGNLIAVGNTDGHVQAYETKTYARLFDIKIQPDQKNSVASINVVDFSPNSQLLAAAGQDKYIRIWDTTNWNEIKVIKNSISPILDIEFSPDGKFIAVGDADEVYIWDLEDDKEVEGFNPQHKTFAVAYSTDGSLLATGGTDRHIRIWRTDTWELVAELTGHKTKIISLEFSFDGQFLISTSEGAGPEYPPTVILWGLPERIPEN